MMTVTDDFTKVVRLYFLRKKSDACNSMQHYLNSEALEGFPVAKVRVDGGGEYNSKELKEFVHKLGIFDEPTVPYSPESNGVAERLNRTLMSKMRAMRHSANLPDYLWEVLVATAAYLHNRSPNKSIGFITPYERHFGIKPDLSHLRIIGSKAFVFIPEEKRQGKLADRSSIQRLLGYGSSPSIYVVWDPTTGRVSKTKDLVIDERATTFDCEPTLDGSDDGDADLEDILDGPLVKYSGYLRQEPLEMSFPEEHQQEAPAAPDPSGTAIRTSHPPLPLPSFTSLPPSSTSVTGCGGVLAPDIHQDGGGGGQVSPGRAPAAPAPVRRSGRVRKETTKAREAREAAARTIEMVVEAAMVTGHKVVSYYQAMKGPKKDAWRRCLDNQYQAYIDNDTWEVVDREPWMNVLTGHWVLVEKPDRLKSRWVVHGNKQKKGYDFTDVYASTALSGSIRMLLAITCLGKRHDGQLDIIDAFLNAKLAELVYMVHPHGYEQEGTVCRLLKALFGLCQSPREWWLDISRKLKQMGFTQCKGDPSVYVNPDGVVIIIYVDDLALFADEKAKIDAAKQQLMDAYKLRDLGRLQTFVGIQILRLPGKVFIHQRDYTNSILERFGFNGMRSVRVPMDDKSVLAPRQDTCPAADLKLFQEMNGSIGWLVTQTRPDMAYTHSKLAQFNANPPAVAIEGMKHLFRYLKGTTDWGILYQSDGNSALIGYTDSNHGDKFSSDAKSTSGYSFHMAGATVSWSSKKQKTTATSSTEAEYIAQCNATKEAVYLRQLLNELGHPEKGSTLIYGDNQAAIALAYKPAVQTRSRHIEFKQHYTREKVEDGTISLSYLPTQQMVADGFTKPLKPDGFDAFRRSLGMAPLSEVSPPPVVEAN
jgi:hypothetical protein